jgi:multimeric flavodoxin WrbA
MEVSILGIQGSSHIEGTTAQLLHRVLDGCALQRSFVSNPYTNKTPPSLKKLFARLCAADGLVFASPVHWFNVSSLMKAFVDQLTILEMQDFELEGKAAAFVATGTEDGGMQANLAMAGPLNQMGLAIPPHALYFYNSNCAAKSEHNWMDEDPELVGANLVKFVRLTKVDDYYWDKPSR